MSESKFPFPLVIVIAFLVGVIATKIADYTYNVSPSTTEDIKVERQDEKTPYGIGDICAIGQDRFVQIKHRYQNSIDTWKYNVVLLTDDTKSIGIYNGLTHDFIDYCNPPKEREVK